MAFGVADLLMMCGACRSQLTQLELKECTLMGRSEEALRGAVRGVRDLFQDKVRFIDLNYLLPAGMRAVAPLATLGVDP